MKLTALLSPYHRFGVKIYIDTMWACDAALAFNLADDSDLKPLAHIQ